MYEDFNPELLLLAREYRGYSQLELAAMAGFDQGHYSRIERGLLNAPISSDSVKRLATSLNFPVEYFFQKDEISGLPLSVHEPAWRKRKSLLATDLRKLRAELNLRIMHLRRFMQAIDITPERKLPQIDVDEVGGPIKAAEYVRKAWQIPPGPIRNLTELCERAGIFVVQASLPAKVDGVTMRLRDVPPIIFLNSSSPPDRMRHSLGHELGHLVMHSLPSETMEEEADAFAGELLVPASELRRDFVGGKITLDRLVRMKRYWKVSVASLIYRAEKNAFILKYQAEYLWRKTSALGWKSGEPEDTQFEAETTKLYDYIIELHEKDMKYTAVDVGNMLHFSEIDVNRLYGFQKRAEGRPKLSVVK